MKTIHKRDTVGFKGVPKNFRGTSGSLGAKRTFGNVSHEKAQGSYAIDECKMLSLTVVAESDRRAGSSLPQRLRHEVSH